MHDFFLFWWELLALNVRKSWFRLRGGRPPCQAPGDSGKARETHCEACALWNKPGRFTRVCPALGWTDGGWRCLANAADVRPFWGRAAGYYGAAAAGLYLAGTLAALGVLRTAGLDAGYRDVAWPPAWRHFDEVRGRHYFAQGRAALAANRTAEANLSLSLAYEFDPGNYEAGLAVAQLWQSGQGTLSDRVYTRLMASHPAEAAGTARAWGRGLLWRGDFAHLAALAGERLEREQPPGRAWLHALIFSARRLGDPAPLAAALGRAGLPNEMRALLQLELRALGGDAAGTAKILAAPLTDGASAYARHYQVSFLTAAGEARRALELLVRYGDRLPPDERVALSLGALAGLGETEEVRRQAGALLRANPRPQIHEILATHLIRQPDRTLLRETVAQFATGAWAETEAGVPANAALLCAAAVDGDTATVDALRARLRRVTGAKAAGLDRIGTFFSAGAGRRKPGLLLPALPMLSPEVVYALFERPEAEARRQP